MLLKLIRMTSGVGNLTLFNDSGNSLFTCFTLENPNFMIPTGRYDITFMRGRRYPFECSR